MAPGSSKSARIAVPAAIPEDPTAPPIDLAHVARQTFGNRDLEHEILRLFLVQSADLAGRIASTQSPDECWHAAHRLKGSARGIGAWGVAERAELVERASEMRRAATGDAVQALAEAVEAANRFIRTHLGD